MTIKERLKEFDNKTCVDGRDAREMRLIVEAYRNAGGDDDKADYELSKIKAKIEEEGKP